MGKKAMQQRMKSWGSFCLILLLLPYVVTVFVHGGEVGREDNSGQVVVKVRKGEGNTDSKMRTYGEDGTTVRAVSRFFILESGYSGTDCRNSVGGIFYWSDGAGSSPGGGK